MNLTLKITPPKVERFRTIPGQQLYLPEGLNLNDYEVVNYLQGERTDRPKCLDVDLFDMIRFVNYSSNTTNQKKFIHLEGYRKREKKYTIFVMRLKSKR